MRLKKMICFPILILMLVSCGESVSSDGLTSSTDKEDPSDQGPNDDVNNPASKGSRITLSRTDSSRPLQDSLWCFNNNTLAFKGPDSPQVRTKTQEMRPRLLRYPGGTVGDFWDWKKGGIFDTVPEAISADAPTAELKQYVTPDSKIKQFTQGKLEDLKPFWDATHTRPLFQLNMITSTMERELELLRHAQSLGLPITHVELANEAYFGFGYLTHVFPTPADYAKTAIQWAKAIKAEFPKTKVAAIGLFSSNSTQKRSKEWNQALLDSGLQGIDAIALHIYFPEGKGVGVTEDMAYPRISDQSLPGDMGMVHKAMEGFEQNGGAVFSEKEVWITEYNVFPNLFIQQKKNDTRFIGTWVHSLAAILSSMVLLEIPNLQVLCNHVLQATPHFSAIFPHEQFTPDSRKDAQPIKVNINDLTATGIVFRLFGQAIDGMTSATKVSFSDPRTLTATGDNYRTGESETWQYAGLYGWIFESGQQRRLLLLNLTQDELSIDYSSILTQTDEYLQLSAEPKTIITGSETVPLNQIKGQTLQALPAYSVNLIYGQ